MSAQCRVCQAKAPGGYLCRACLRTLEQAIAELPADLRDLQLVATRQATGPLGLGVGRLWDGPYEVEALGDAPWVFAQGAADQLWAAANTIGTWCRHLAESRGASLPRAREGTSVPLRPLVEWLLTNLDSIRYDEAAEVLFEEFTGLHRENERWTLGRQGMDRFAGRCEATSVTFEMGDAGELVPVAAQCGANMYGHDDEEDLRCPDCGMRYKLAERLDALHDRQVNDQLARAHVIADALTTLDEPLGRDLLRKWIQRDALLAPAPLGPACEDCNHAICRVIRRPRIVVQGMDEDGHRLYRVGDVRRRLAVAVEQRGIRLSA